jgi:hypothetical protein
LRRLQWCGFFIASVFVSISSITLVFTFELSHAEKSR